MKSILIIDDEKILVDMFEKILSRFGYDVQIAQTGEEGIRLFESKDFDLVITDVIMPEMDGNFIAKYIRNSSKNYIPVIGMTGTPGYAEGDCFDVLLSKPFSVETLVKSVENFVSAEKSAKTGS